MTDHDPAFLWETEAIRSATPRVVEAGLDTARPVEVAGRWVTLREASRSTGIPVETLRKWARRATIPTYLSPASGGVSIRMVDLDGVIERAAELGRAIAPTAEIDRAPSQPETAPQPSPPASASSPPSHLGAEGPTPLPPAPPGTMIVPVDAWNKMLNQLGNLHEAGQHLAEARERAAKAETEAKFLRERLSELRQESEPSTPPPTTAPPAPPAPPAADEPGDDRAEPPEKVWRYLIRRVRDRGLG